MDQNLIEYFGNRISGSQWKGFLRCVAEELANVGSEAELHALAQRAGARFAIQHPLPICQTLDDIQQAICSVWHEADWGWVTLTEQADHIQITHYCSPLTSGFGDARAGWVIGYLEGAYEQWFHAIDPNSPLHVQATGPLDALGTAQLRLGA